MKRFTVIILSMFFTLNVSALDIAKTFKERPYLPTCIAVIGASALMGGDAILMGSAVCGGSYVYSEFTDVKPEIVKVEEDISKMKDEIIFNRRVIDILNKKYDAKIENFEESIKIAVAKRLKKARKFNAKNRRKLLKTKLFKNAVKKITREIVNELKVKKIQSKKDIKKEIIKKANAKVGKVMGVKITQD